MFEAAVHLYNKWVYNLKRQGKHSIFLHTLNSTMERLAVLIWLCHIASHFIRIAIVNIISANYMASREHAKFQTKHQNEEEGSLNWLWTWHGSWIQMGWSEYFRNCWSTGIFTRNAFYGLQGMVIKREKTQWVVKIPCWCSRSGESDQIACSWQ